MQQHLKKLGKVWKEKNPFKKFAKVCACHISIYSSDSVDMDKNELTAFIYRQVCSLFKLDSLHSWFICTCLYNRL